MICQLFNSVIYRCASCDVLLQNRVHRLLPFAIMGINALVAGILCMTLPETKNQPTLETVNEGGEELVQTYEATSA